MIFTWNEPRSIAGDGLARDFTTVFEMQWVRAAGNYRNFVQLVASAARRPLEPWPAHQAARTVLEFNYSQLFESLSDYFAINNQKLV